MVFIKNLFKLLFHRVFYIGAAILLQIIVLIAMIYRFQSYFVYFYAVSLLISGIAVIAIANGRSKPGYKIAWIILIMLFPIFGGLFYLIFGGKPGKRTRNKMQGIAVKMDEVLTADNIVSDYDHIEADAARQMVYIYDYANCPGYSNTMTKYLPSGEMKFELLMEELKKAEHYIFLEYFIIAEGKMWDTILEVLVAKARAGVDVRLIYDDIGCILNLPYQYDKYLEELGIKCCIFNPFRPVASPRFNNRDHRKIVVIDGHTGFTGGINLADEYINEYERFGHWKDTAILIKGNAVWSLTVMFLSMWDYLSGWEEDYEQFKPHVHQKEKHEDNEGIVQPYMDNPLDDEPIGETVYLNMINRAKDYIYITTPYLVLDNEMMGSLFNAAKQGVDVRIITPHIPDKWYVHEVSRDNYIQLLEAGVRIFEYTPGFIHGKAFVIDDKFGTVGTINLDYRSLYLHFECGVWLYNTSSVMEIKDDFLATQAVSHEINLQQARGTLFNRIVRGFLRLFAPLM